MATAKKYYATGKRKTSIACVYLKPGDGKITVNDKDMNSYFGRATDRMIIVQPFELTNLMGKLDVLAVVRGGGLSGQADALKHGITKALLEYDEKLRPTLKKAGFITRDAREKEREKYGQRGARARYQYSKR